MASPVSGPNITPITTPLSCSTSTATISRRCATCRNERSGLAPAAIRQREGARRRRGHIGLLVGLGVGLLGIGTDDLAGREGHPRELAVLEHEARATGPVLVGFGPGERVRAVLFLLFCARHGS